MRVVHQSRFPATAKKRFAAKPKKTATTVTTKSGQVRQIEKLMAALAVRALLNRRKKDER